MKVGLIVRECFLVGQLRSVLSAGGTCSSVSLAIYAVKKEEPSLIHILTDVQSRFFNIKGDSSASPTLAM